MDACQGNFLILQLRSGEYGEYMLGLPPYSPEDYELRQSFITIVAGNNKFVSFDNRRVYLAIQHTSILVVAGAYFTFNGMGDQIYRGVLTGNGIFELTWIKNYAMVNSEIWGNAFAVGDTFSVMEVLYNPLGKQKVKDATRKHETLTAKIKRFSESIRRGS